MKRLWQDIRKHHRWLLGGAALILFTRWIYLRSLPERMIEVTAPIQAIHNGKIYLLRQDWERADFQMCLADRPVEQRIAREVLHGTQVAGLSVVESGIYYVLQPRGLTPSVRALPGRRPSANIQRRSFELRRIPLDGGEPASIPMRPGQPNPVIAGNAVYWLEPDTFSPEGRVATNRLMTASVSGGPAATLHRGLPRRVQLTSSSDGVYWIQPAKDDHKSLFHMGLGDRAPRVISPYVAKQAPVEMEGRIYWAEDRADGRNATLELISAHPDGTDRQSAFRLSTYYKIDGSGPAERISRIIPHAGKLYFLTIRSEDRTSSDTTQPAELYCVEAGPAAVARKIHRFDNLYDRYVFIDGGYYYYTVIELQEASMFSFSKEGLFLKRQPVLYRYRLPG